MLSAEELAESSKLVQSQMDCHKVTCQSNVYLVIAVCKFVSHGSWTSWGKPHALLNSAIAP